MTNKTNKEVLEEAAKLVEWIGDNEGVEEIAEMMAAAIRQLEGGK